MALSSLIQFEVRPTTGGANNGGGFKAGASGTDRSQQAAAQVVINNSTITCTTPAANSNTLTFTLGYTPSAADIGNCVAITAGTNINAGIYEITGQSSTTWTLAGAANLTTATAGGSAITGNMGGARNGFSTGTSTLQSQLVGGNKVWIKNEAWNESPTSPAIGTSTAPMVYEGYNTARGDAPTGANMPTLDRANVAGVAWNCNSTQNTQYRFIRVRRSGTVGFSAAAGRFEGCRSDTNGTDGWSMGSNSVLVGCEADSNTGMGINGNANFTSWIAGCYIHGNTSFGISGFTGGQTVMCCIISANAAHGVSNGSNAGMYFGNTIDGNTGVTTDGINNTTPSWLTSFIGNNLTNNGRYGLNATALSTPFADYNNFFGNGTAARNLFTAGTHDQTVDPQYTNRAGGDFSIGYNVKGLGYPNTFPQGLSTGYPDIGAVQRQDPAAIVINTTSNIFLGPEGADYGT